MDGLPVQSEDARQLPHGRFPRPVEERDEPRFLKEAQGGQVRSEPTLSLGCRILQDFAVGMHCSRPIHEPLTHFRHVHCPDRPDAGGHPRTQDCLIDLCPPGA